MKKVLQFLLLTALTTGVWGCSSNDAGSGDPVSANSDQQVAPDTSPAPNTEYVPSPAPSTPSRVKASPPPARRETPKVVTNAPAESNTNAPAESSRPVEAKPVETKTDVVETPRPAAIPARAMTTVPEGTRITATLIDPLSTETNAEGDTFTASLTEPIMVDGKVVAEKGSRVQGRVEQVEEPGKVKGRAALELVLTGIQDGSRMIDLSTEPFTAVAEDNKDRDAGIIAGGAGVGAIIGAIAGGKKGAAIGAVLGGGSGTTAVLVTRGEHIRLDSETKVNFVLNDAVRLPLIRAR